MSIQPAAFAPARAADALSARPAGAATYRYVFADLLTDRTIDTLPMTGVSFDRLIGRAGAFSGTIPVPNAKMGKRVEPIRAGRTALYVYRSTAFSGSELWWGGIVWTLTPTGDDKGNTSVQVSAATFDSYAHRRIIRTNMRADQIDQFTWEQALWTVMQDTPNGNIGVIVPTGVCGVPRDRSILATDGKTFGDAIAELQDNLNGWESTIDVYVDPATGQRVKKLRQGHPTLGRNGGEPVTYSRPGDLLTYSFPEDTTRGGTSFQARGSTPESNVAVEQVPLMSAVYNSDDLLSTGWPQLDVQLDHSSVTEQATLENHAKAAREAQRLPFVVPSVTVRPGSFEPGNIGDTARFRITDALHPRRPGGGVGRELLARVVGLAVSAPDRGQAETHSLILNESE